MGIIKIYDTTLRDGAQQEGISFGVTDKLKIIGKLDELGIHYIEGGWPGGNPKDTEVFLKAQSLDLKNSVLVAFGSTRRYDSSAEEDATLNALIAAKTSTVTIVGKSWDMQATNVLEVSLDENLRMIGDSVAYLKSKGLTVFFDAEHYFDGFKENPEYALRTIEIARDAGADCVVLCDTNGGSLPAEIAIAVEAAKAKVDCALGIHVHNDSDLAVANTLMAVQSGVTQVQGTINGYGERCGNANLCSIIPNIQLKLGLPCLTEEQIAELTTVSRYVADLANIALFSHLPYVGASAFTHKAGLHVSGMMKWENSYQHINPLMVGNRPQVVVSELSGKGNILYKAKELGVNLPPRGKMARQVLEQIKMLESHGFQFEGADASFELLLSRAQTGYKPFFELIDYMVIMERHRRQPTSGITNLLSEATVKVKVGGKVMHTASEGNGPVNALDQALRKGLLEFYPELATIKLVDYKVHILEESSGTASQVRVLIESRDNGEQWKTVGSSTNIIEASWLALVDSMEYPLYKRKTGK